MAVTKQQGALLFPSNIIISVWHDIALIFNFIVGKFIVPWDVVLEEYNFLWTLERSTNSEMGGKDIERFR